MNPKFLWDLRFFRTKNFFSDSTFFWTQNYVMEKEADLVIFRPQKFFRPNVYSDPKCFLNPKFVLDPKFLFDLKMFWDKIFFWTKLFPDTIFFKPNIFWQNQNFFWPDIFSDPKGTDALCHLWWQNFCTLSYSMRTLHNWIKLLVYILHSGVWCGECSSSVFIIRSFFYF